MSDVAATDLAAFRAEARDWLAEQEPPQISGYWLDHVPALRSWQRKLWEGGLVGVAYPEELGGRGLTLMHQAVADEEIVRRRAPAAIGVPGLTVAGPVLARFGSERQRQLVPRLLSGDELWSLGFSEPDAGSDLAAARTTAVVDGDEFVINGTKVWTGFAAYSTWLLLIARTDPDAPKHRGLSLFVVPMDGEGISKTPLREMSGEPDAERTQFYRLRLDDVRVGADAVIGEVNEGWKYIVWGVGRERGPYLLLRQAELAGHFGRLLDSLEGVELPEAKVAEIGRVSILLDVLRAQSARTAERITEHPGESSPEDSADKLLVAAVEQAMNHLSLDLLGPYRGFQGTTSLGLDAHMYGVNYMYSRAASLYGGTDQVQRNIISRRGLELPDG